MLYPVSYLFILTSSLNNKKLTPASSYFFIILFYHLQSSGEFETYFLLLKFLLFYPPFSIQVLQVGLADAIVLELTYMLVKQPS